MDCNGENYSCRATQTSICAGHAPVRLSRTFPKERKPDRRATVLFDPQLDQARRQAAAAAKRAERMNAGMTARANGGQPPAVLNAGTAVMYMRPFRPPSAHHT